jgi:hypothetical protein
LNSRRLLLALILAVLAALALALPASSIPAPEGTCDGTPLVSLRATLSGVEEIDPETGNRGAGDLNASGRARVEVFPEGVFYRLRFEGLEEKPATRGHIHLGAPGENGPILVTLFDSPEEPVESRSKGCVAPDVAPRAVIELLKENPGEFYVNVHNEEFPNGAIRGQLRERM